jgi:HEAT repeat protein
VNGKRDRKRIARWLLSVFLVAQGVGLTWAWGQVARLAEPAAEAESGMTPLYAVWQPEGANAAQLFRSTDSGATWQPVVLPGGSSPKAWASDGGQRLAVALADGTLLRSANQGERWAAESMILEGGTVPGPVDRADRGANEPVHLPVTQLAWGAAGTLYLGADGFGVYELAADGALTPLSEGQAELATARIAALAVAGDRLLAATPSAVFYTDDGGRTWDKSFPVPNGLTALAAIDADTLFVGTETDGIYRSTDGGRTWEPALAGLGLAAGQLVRITALRADPQEPGVLYAAVDHLLGSTELHASAAGTFVTLDGGQSWQPLAGPGFPEAEQATDLVVAKGRPLYAQAVTLHGLESYAPDVAGAMAALHDPDPQVRAAAAQVLGLARVQAAGDALMAALDDPEPAVSLAAADALGRINDPALVSGLLAALEHPQEQVRLGAARALGAMRVEAAVVPLRAMLLQGEGLEVTVAAEALQKIASPAAVDGLLAALTDSVATPRWHAAMGAVERLGEPAVAPLTAMLEQGEGYARRNAAEALGWIGSPSAVTALARALDDPAGGVRRQAAWALGEIGDPAARAALETVAANDLEPAVRAEASWALAQLEAGPQAATAAASWSADLAQALSRLEPARWLFLAASLLAAAWLAIGNRRLAPARSVSR